MMSPSQIKTGESMRQSSTRALLSELLAHGLTQTVNKDQSSADHSITQGRTETPFGCSSPLIIEEKPELGTGGDCSVQASFSFQSTWLQNQILSCSPIYHDISVITLVQYTRGQLVLQTPVACIQQAPRAAPPT
ncbi:hypothetical protein HGRIS_001115 [Hohenbuehelia grisea]|uniref:Uncharacterized protein n=1 Tax=Hohenbuehelia grisea TaxID=104357 RepID=A0ABR3JNA5_9AGAR